MKLIIGNQYSTKHNSQLIYNGVFQLNYPRCEECNKHRVNLHEFENDDIGFFYYGSECIKKINLKATQEARQ